ncbi:hypothetical protein QBC37DRAFT_419132 [Rhypophila decipiens]|uniref:NAD dependent epimerase/dehydratase n=1 Tax=Rhypophila decipiens TaxID=261697 RepID=A0AAN6YBG1_9PEZI|nr:hypothetical protein QBC37DRAFT_419132 [Rhypophila decipiens]
MEILLDGPPHDSGIQSLGGPVREQKLWLEIMELAPRAKTLPEQKKLDYLIAEVLDGYTCTSDIPAVLLTPEILRVYPDAIVIATTRDPAPWYESVLFMKSMTSKWYIPFIVFWIPGANNLPKWDRLRQRMTLWRMGYAEFESETCLADHEAHLRSVIPPEKLFWFRPKEGWEPLCEILGVEVPKDKPFPHSNSKEDASRVVRQIVVTGLVMWTGVIGAAGCVSWLAWNGWGRFMIG